MGKGHDGIADELKLGLELGVILGQALFTCADSLVALIVRGAHPTRIAAFEMVLPKFWKNIYWNDSIIRSNNLATGMIQVTYVACFSSVTRKWNIFNMFSSVTRKWNIFVQNLPKK